MSGDTSAMMPVEQPKNSPRTITEAIEQVVMANRILANEGILDALGHVSLRSPENRQLFFSGPLHLPLRGDQG